MTNEIVNSLCQKFGVTMPETPAWQIFKHLSAFWHHFGLHTRKCDKTGKTIISVFDETCPYPVWHREEWMKNSEPPGAKYDPDRPFFEQLWDFWQKSPIPHNVGAGNENCEYTDDWWYCRNSYLSHSGVGNEDAHYCYRVLNLKDSEFCVFSFRSELSVDLINCTECYNLVYAINSRQCRDSAFLFDCRNVSDSLFCWNLRNKQYCIFNKQYTRQEYEIERAKYDFSSRKNYEEAKKTFYEILTTKAYWKNVDMEQCENCDGDIMNKCKNCTQCFMISDGEDCAYAFRGGWLKDNLLTVSTYEGELVYYSCTAQDKCYDIRFCFNLIRCKFMEYSAHCYNSEHCFGCCGLTNKKYYIFNKPYLEKEWHKKVKEIKEDLMKDHTMDTASLRSAVEYGQFFPGYFAASPYEESLAGFHWPLTREQQIAEGFRTKEFFETEHPEFSSPDEIPDNVNDVDKSICQKTFWDPVYRRAFRIMPFDLEFCKARGVPLPNCFYVRRIKENFSWLFFNGTLRETTCALTGEKIMTGVPTAFDGRIVSKEAYLDQVV